MEYAIELRVRVETEGGAVTAELNNDGSVTVTQREPDTGNFHAVCGLTLETLELITSRLRAMKEAA